MSHIAEYVDRLATVEMRPGSGNIPHGQIHRLYGAARERNGEPLVLSAGRTLAEQVRRGDSVLIVTGAGGPPLMPHAEVDGLLGTVALARVLVDRVGARVAILAEERCAPPLQATLRAAALNMRREGETDEAPGTVTFVPTAIDDEECRRAAVELLDRYRPAAVVAIEKLGPNERGHIHGATGVPLGHVHTKPEHLFGLARERSIPTIGIGDGGNEVGFGAIADEVTEIILNGQRCLCPCEGRTGTITPTDHLIVAAISNWGAYALSAMVLKLTGGGVRELIDEDELERMLRACIDGGAFDGAFSRAWLSDDIVPLATHRAYITMLRSILTISDSDLVSPNHDMPEASR